MTMRVARSASVARALRVVLREKPAPLLVLRVFGEKVPMRAREDSTRAFLSRTLLGQGTRNTSNHAGLRPTNAQHNAQHKRNTYPNAQQKRRALWS